MCMFCLIAFTVLFNTNHIGAAGECDPSLKLNCHVVAQSHIVDASAI